MQLLSINFISIDKFNSTVQGSLVTELDDSNKLPIGTVTSVTSRSTSWTTTQIANLTSTYNNSVTPMTTLAVTLGSNLNIIEVGSVLFYTVVGAGSGVLILLLIILMMFITVCYLATNKR